MITCKNLYDNKNVEIIDSKGGVKVLEYKKDLSVNVASAINAYFASEMNVRKRQVLIELNGDAYTNILIEDVADWNGLVLDDGLFLACESKIKQKVVARTNISSAMLGKEGLFNLCLEGEGVAVLESPVPRDELIEINLENDEVRIDGNFAIAWSKSLDFRVEKSSKSLVGSAVSGEGFVNVYRGTGKILMAPIA